MTFIYNQIKSFQSEGHTVKIVTCEVLNETLFPWNGISKIEIKKDMSFFISKIKRGLGLEFTLYNKPFLKAFKKEVIDFKPDIVHAQFGIQLIRIFPAIKNFNIPVITTFHGYDASKYLKNGPYVRKLRSILALENTYATTISKDMKNRLGEHGIDVSKTYVNYLGVDTTFFRPAGKEDKEGPKIFLQVSNFVEKKGHEYTIKAFTEHIRETGAKNKHLILAGEGPLLLIIKELTQSGGISEYVEFPGLVNRKQVKELMEKADCFVHHSITAKDGDMEGLPTVIMEAMAMELPIISTLHAGIPELVDSPDHGILVEEKDIESYTKAFKEIEKSKAKTSREKILSQFNLDKNTKKILGIFEGIIHEH